MDTPHHNAPTDNAPTPSGRIAATPENAAATGAGDYRASEPPHTYSDEALTVRPKLVEGIGWTYDPLRGGDWWECPFCRDNTYEAGDRCESRRWVGTYERLREHLGTVHNLRVVDQELTLRVGRLYTDDGQVVRHQPHCGDSADD